MKKFLPALLLIGFLESPVSYGQNMPIDRVHFFEDTSVINATITTDLTSIFKRKAGVQCAANFSATLPDGSVVNEPILLEVRGHFRKDYCYVPPLRVVFKTKKNSVMRPLGTLKLVSECKLSATDDQYLLKEFLAYKIYNLLTDMSFRVRLLNLHLVDSANRKKPITEHAFLVEDIKFVAERNNCVDLKDTTLNTQATDRRQMTLVGVFEYMIANTDWGVSYNHNTRLISSKADSLRRPFVVPYDFDYSGFVNTDYAVPDERLSLQNVRERLYRGYPRSTEEINEVLDIFKKQKDSIYSLISDFSLLTLKNKQDLIHFLDEFFEMIKKPGEVDYIFTKGER